ncbi:MAG: glycoside hydrolase family 3 C-terminal domain-containing protein [Candidatus Weimeria sp.]
MNKKWMRAFYTPNLPLGKDGSRVTGSSGHIALSKEAAKAGMVLLKNEGQKLPLRGYHRIALFGKASIDYVKGGGGSGDVNCAYTKNLYDGFKEEDNIRVYEPLAEFYKSYVHEMIFEEDLEPGMMPEAKIPKELLRGAAASCDTAFFVISRFSGEGWDRSPVEGPVDPGLEFLHSGPKKKKKKGERTSYWEKNMLELSAKIFQDMDFYLTKKEKKALSDVEKYFDDVVVVLNIGGMMDLSWVKNDKNIKAALLMWQPGMEGGPAAADILVGKDTPSGKLPDTFAEDLKDYPSADTFFASMDHVDYYEDIYVGYRWFETMKKAADKVVYPFGYGLSYTTFRTQVVSADEKVNCNVKNRKCFGHITFTVRVTNTGEFPGKEVTGIYVAKPDDPVNGLGNPARELAAFKKTKLLAPGESQDLLIKIRIRDLASYDDTGRIQKSAWVLQKGTYRFFLGINSMTAEEIEFTHEEKKNRVTEQLEECLTPDRLKYRLLSDGSKEALPSYIGDEALKKADSAKKPFAAYDENVLEPIEKGYQEGVVSEERCVPIHRTWDNMTQGVHEFHEVYEGKISLDDFMDQLSDEDLAYLLGGQRNTGVANTYGIGNNAKYWIPNVMTSDGPAGVRINEECGIKTTDFPCSVLLAASFDTDIVERVGAAGGAELKENNMYMWLTPAICIHRSPYCGRNFEYYSEDPLLTGKIAAAMVKGIQSNGVSASVKHFAANNKETNRKDCDSRVSERALREIYLKGFEICVKEADPWSIMSSYNRVNGTHSSENRDLLTTVLRNDWGYKGIVTTDWWTYGEQYREILAGNDVKMPDNHPDRVLEAMEKGAITRDDLYVCAKRVLEFLLKLD